MSLLKILLSKRVLHSRCPALAHKISMTIAHLLRPLKVSLQRTITKDLFDLCFDLSLRRRVKTLESNATVRILLFTETAGENASNLAWKFHPGRTVCLTGICNDYCS
jgi:hypothetical protein